MMLFIKKTTAALLCVMLVIGGAACVQQPSDPGVGRNVAQTDLSALEDDEDVLIFEADSKENLLNKAYVVARLESLRLYLQHEAKAISPAEFDAEEKRLRTKWVEVAKLADEVIRMYSSPVSSLKLWEQFRRLLAPQEAWAGQWEKARLDRLKAEEAQRIKEGAYVYQPGSSKQAGIDQAKSAAGGAFTAGTGFTAIITAPATGPLAPVVFIGGIVTTMNGLLQMAFSDRKDADYILSDINKVDAALGWVNAPGAIKTVLTNPSGLQKIGAAAGLLSTADSTNKALTPRQELREEQKLRESQNGGTQDMGWTTKPNTDKEPTSTLTPRQELRESQNRGTQNMGRQTTQPIRVRHGHSG